jgi:hypothetical protein
MVQMDFNPVDPEHITSLAFMEAAISMVSCRSIEILLLINVVYSLIILALLPGQLFLRFFLSLKLLMSGLIFDLVY